MKLKPVDDHVVVRRDAEDEYTTGGVALSPGARETPMTGTVLAVGPGLLARNGARLPVAVSPGERVFFLRNAGREIAVSRGDGGHEVFQVLREDELLAAVDP